MAREKQPPRTHTIFWTLPDPARERARPVPIRVHRVPQVLGRIHAQWAGGRARRGGPEAGLYLQELLPAGIRTCRGKDVRGEDQRQGASRHRAAHTSVVFVEESSGALHAGRDVLTRRDLIVDAERHDVTIPPARARRASQ